MRNLTPLPDLSRGDLPHDISLRASIAQRTRLEIVSGKSAPGFVFSVPGLAKALGTSTTPVREALLELSAAGLLEPVKNRGFRVLQASDADLKQLASLRVELEVIALFSIDRVSQEDTFRLRKLAERIEDAVVAGDIPQFVDADRRFHLEVISLAGNRYLTGMVMQLRDNMRIYGLESEAGRRQQKASVAEHYRLLELLSTGNKAALVALMRAHILDWVPVVSAGGIALGSCAAVSAPVNESEAAT